MLSYVCLDADGNEVDQGMGRTLNIGEGGLLLETYALIETEFILLMAMGLNENLLEIKGKVVFCRPKADGNWEVGVAFLDRSEQTRRVLVEFVRIAIHKRSVKS